MEVPIAAKYSVKDNKIVSARYEYAQTEKSEFVDVFVQMLARAFNLDQFLSPN